MTALTSPIARHRSRKLSQLPRALCSCRFSMSRLLLQKAVPNEQVQSFPADAPPPASDSPQKPEDRQMQPKKRRRIVFEHEIDNRPEWLKNLSRQRDRAMAFYIKLVKKQPFIFYGGPFLTLIVVASYYLQEFTEIRYKAHDQKKQMATEDDLDPRKNSTNSSRFRNETREEYYKRNYKLLQSEATEDYEIKRIERRPGDPPVKW
ncbi:cytochrome c oxidase assembly protein COX16-domain-containing protein [Lipomyces orientalis]|uniref:Cytochrome c oxidase assembly protein COX16-domain-containing protein n=1 Tax=Lipomyces orientalis TaxID=1233043 RepID=A0ACC3TVK2_9ASCO